MKKTKQKVIDLIQLKNLEINKHRKKWSILSIINKNYHQ